MNLILTELLVSLIGIPVDAVASIRGGWDLGMNLCVSIGFLLTFLGKYNGNLITCNYDRFNQLGKIITMSQPFYDWLC